MSGGYWNGTLQNTRPSLKYQRETVKEASASRSRLRSEKIRRQSNSPTTNRSSSGPKIQGSLIFFPNAPFEPRAIDHATCGPVQADWMAPVLSLTITRATSSPLAHQWRTQVSFSKAVDDVILACARW